MGVLGDDDPEASLYVGAAETDAASATASLAGASVTLANTSETVAFDLERTSYDLAALAANGTAQLAGSSPEVQGDIRDVTLVFDELVVDGEPVNGTQLSVPMETTVTPTTTLTVTLDLDATAQTGEPTLRQAVAERGGEVVETVTGAELEEPEEPPELATPTIVATAEGGNVTGPSFAVNQDINFTYQLPSTNEATVDDVFWSFGDQSTATGPLVEHAYRAPGFYRVTLVLEGEQGQQATATTAIDAYHTEEGDGNVGAGTGGEALIQDRDVREHNVSIAENFTSVNIRVDATPSGGFCADENDTSSCAPSNVHVEWESPDGTIVAENTTDDQVKWINVTGLMDQGEWTLRVKGDQGAAVGYSYMVKAHFFGLCAERGGLEGFGCPGEPGAAGSDG